MDQFSTSGTIAHPHSKFDKYRLKWIFAFSHANIVMHRAINKYMMTSSNENIFCVTGPVWGESTGQRWIPFTMASDAELWCFLWSTPDQTVEQTLETPVIWDAIALIMESR